MEPVKYTEGKPSRAPFGPWDGHAHAGQPRVSARVHDVERQALLFQFFHERRIKRYVAAATKPASRRIIVTTEANHYSDRASNRHAS